MAPTKKFLDGEQVLCFHGKMLYEAKVLRSALPQKIGCRELKYFIHYTGWNKNWDEWVDEKRILKYISINLRKQRELKRLSEATYGKAVVSKTRKSVSSGKTVASMRTSTAAKRSVSDRGSIDSEIKETLELKLKLPMEAKELLVEDWHAINLQWKLHDLPAKLTVDRIIASYVQTKKENSPMNHDQEAAFNAVIETIPMCFNRIFDSQLLYKSERPQYDKLLHQFPCQAMSQICGAFHLLRLFTKLGPLLTSTSLDQQSLDSFAQHAEDFLKFLIENKENLFSMEQFVSGKQE